MKFLKQRLSIQVCITKPFAFHHFPKTQFHTNHLKPPKANQTLKNYIKSNCPTKALSLFREILRKNLSTIDSYSLLFVLKACTQKSSFIEGQNLHCIVIKLGFEHVIQLQTALIRMYSETHNLMDAQKVFDEMPERNVVSWTALISAYVENRKPNEALRLFRRMQMDNVEPDRVAITVTLSACADLGALVTGEWIGAYVRRKGGLGVDLRLNNALVNMYAKCGDLEGARRVFEGMRRKDVTTWTSMIVAHALHGQAREALELFARMRPTAPNDVTFVGVLMSCSHAGLVEEGKRQFRSMVEDYGLAPREPHFGCMVDLFCRAGLLEEACAFVAQMPAPARSAVAWRTLLGACCGALGGDGDVDVGLGAGIGRRLLELEPEHGGDGVALSNMYAAKGMWERKVAVRDEQRMRQRRSPGCSSIEVGSDGVCEFVAGDHNNNNNHPLRAQICEVLKSLVVTMKDCGSFSHISCVDR